MFRNQNLINIIKNVIAKKCHFNIVIKRFIQPPLSPFVKGELDDDLIYSPLCRGILNMPFGVRGLFLFTFSHFLTIAKNGGTRSA